MRNHAYRQGAADLRRGRRDAHLPDAAVSQHPQPRHQPHERQSAGRRGNKCGQTHDIKNLFVSDGSQFTTGGACNPTLTIVALAIRQAEHMAGMMSRKEI